MPSKLSTHTNSKHCKSFVKMSRDWFLATALYDAVDDSDIRQVTVLVTQKHASPNIIIPEYGISPLHLAVGHETETFAKVVVKLMLQYGGNANLRAEDGITPLHVAAAWNRASLTRILLAYGGDPWLVDDNEKNSFHHAYEEHAWDALRTLDTYRNLETDPKHPQYTLTLEKVILFNNDVQAEFEAKREINIPSETSTASTQTSKIDQEWTTYKESNSLNDMSDEYDWCKQLSNVTVDDGSKHKIVNHRQNSNVYEYNPPVVGTVCVDMNELDSYIQEGLLNINDIDAERDENGDKITDCDPTENVRGDIGNLEEELKNISENLDESQAIGSHEEKKGWKDKDILHGIMGNPKKVDEGIENVLLNLTEEFDDLENKCLNDNCDINSSANIADQKEIRERNERHVSWIEGIRASTDGSTDGVYLSCTEELNDSLMRSPTACSTMGIQDTGKLYDLNISQEFKYEDDNVVLIERRSPFSIKLVESDEEDTVADRVVDENQETSDGTAYETDCLRSELKNRGFKPGPITSTTKRLYLRKLKKLKKSNVQQSRIELPPCFSAQLEEILNADDDDWKKILGDWSSLEGDMTNFFTTQVQTNRESKTSFTYLLLDPRITVDLPYRSKQMDLKEVWNIFIKSIFYVGKGKSSRPYAHLYEAFSIWNMTNYPSVKNCSRKVRHILDIWKSNLGVVCLHVFQNVTSSEAYTREAAMIDAVGLNRLKNERSGKYYGCCSSWRRERKCQLGSYLLYRAMMVLIADGERQLKPTDLA